MTGLPVVTEPARALCSGPRQSALSDDLIGWREGLVLSSEWLDAGGPLDATERIPCGAFRCRLMTVAGEPIARIVRASIPRDGLLS